MLSLLYLGVKARQYFVNSSCMFLDKKTLLQIWLNPRFKLTFIRGTGPRYLSSIDKDWNAVPGNPESAA